jgi:hypothetical protein
MRTLKSWMLLFAAGAGFSSLSALAQHTFRPYAGLALTNYSIKFDNNASPGYANTTAKSAYLAPVVGFTWVSPQRIYVDAQYQTSLSATHDLWKDIGSQDQDFSRSSYTVTAGYVHVLSGGSTVSAFGGITGGKSTLNAPGQPFMTWTEDVFTSIGPFVGGAWGTAALGGSISLSGALALMAGNWKDNSPAPNTFDADAKSTVGFGFAAGYTYRLTPAWAITADLRIQSYSYTFDPDTPASAPDYKVTENIRALGARASYQF